MPYIDLSYEGRHQAERCQLDNGKLPHGGYRGSRRHPLMYLSFDKGREFQEIIDQEVARVLDDEDFNRYGCTPSWSILLHKSPSYTDESVLMRNDLLAANKMEQSTSYDLFDPLVAESSKPRRAVHYNGLKYYRPNRTHQYLTTTELRDFAEGDVNIKYGRPTRTTLLRARQRSNSAPQERRDFLHHLEEIRQSAVINSNPPYLDLQEVREGESLHSYLTGARYNRMHCLDAKSVANSGVYMPRVNPGLGCFFSGPKGLWYLETLKQDQEPGSQEDHVPVPPPVSPRLQEETSHSAPGRDRSLKIPPIVGIQPADENKKETSSNPTDELKKTKKQDLGKSKHKHKNLDLNVTGRQLSISGIKLPSIFSPNKITSNDELTYKLSQSKSIKVVALDNGENKIEVEMNQVLAPVLDSPTVSDLKGEAGRKSPSQESAALPEQVSDSIVERRKHETSPIPEEDIVQESNANSSSDDVIATNSETNLDVSEKTEVNLEELLARVEHNEEMSKEICPEETGGEPIDAVFSENTKDSDADISDQPLARHEDTEETRGDIEGQADFDEDTLDAADDVVQVDELDEDDETLKGKDAQAVSNGGVAFFLTEHEGESKVTTEGHKEEDVLSDDDGIN
ncbi:hypothetical protein BgiBS90_028351 [Biomphalaria glabrata]|nr:hypothetical protein BgiBS90_028351 [Biomphalaria glabrata]